MTCSFIDIIKLLRPHQWLKNLMLLFPPFLGGVMLQIDSFAMVALPLISFSAGASSIYILNDIMDAEQDAHHRIKKLRPLPSKQVSVPVAASIGLLLALGSVLLAVQLSLQFTSFLLAYLVISAVYSCFLKTAPLLEMFCVVSGFLLRLAAGGSAFDVKISDWLFLSVFLLALFLISGKRLGEQRQGKDTSVLSRPVLASYPPGFLAASMYMSGAAVLMTYTMYVIQHQGHLLLIPLCYFGLLKYMLRVLSGQGGDPTRALLRDPVLLVVGGAWVVLVALGTYLR